MYYDTGLAANIPALAATREVTSLDRIVFGTDWPYATLPADGDDPAPALAWLGSEGRDAVDGRNARALVPALAQSLAG
jgi:6-methylsalicylate decarboxylase